MRCSKCQQENAESNNFCMYCGTRLPIESYPEEGSGQEGGEATLEQLQTDINSLRHELDELRSALTGYFISRPQRSAQEVARVLRQRPIAPPSPYNRPAEEEAWRSGEKARPFPQVTEWLPGQAQAIPRLEPQPAMAGGPPSGPSRSFKLPFKMPWEGMDVDWEFLVGGNWLARIGVVAVIIGMGFFLKLAFDNNWINETGRVVLGIVGGLAMLGAGEYWRVKYPTYAQALAGGGIALLYLSLFAAFAIFGLIGLYPAVGLLLLVSVASALLALRYDSIAMAIMGIFGAFAAPFVTGAFVPGDSDVARAGPTIQHMVYVMIVDLGVLALATFRNWQWFTRLALVGSLISFGSWYGEYGEEAGVLTAQASITAIFLIFVGATTLFHLIRRRIPNAFDYALMLTNAVAYFGISYGLMWVDFREWMGGFTFVLSLFFGGIAYLAYVRNKKSPDLALMATGIALVFFTIAIPVQLGGPWMSVAWAAEGVVLLWLSLRLRLWTLRVFSVGMFLAFAAWLLALDTPEAMSASLTPFLNKYLPAYLVAVGATYLAAYLVRKNSEKLFEQEGALYPAFLVAANVFLTVAVPVQVGGVWIAVAWAVEAAALMWLGLHLKIFEIRVFSIGVFATLAVRLLAFDMPAALDDQVAFTFTQYLAPFLVSIGAAYFSALLLWRYRQVLRGDEEQLWYPVMLVLGSAFLATAIPVHIEGVWITVAWAAEAAGLMWLALRLRVLELRVASIVMFTVTAVTLLAVVALDALDADLTPFYNRYLVTLLVAIMAVYFAAYLVKRQSDRLIEYENRAWFPGLLGMGAVFLTVAIPTQVDGVWIAVGWAIEAAAFMWLALRLDVIELRLSSIGVLITLVVRLLAVDTMIDLDGFRLLLNDRMLAFVSGIAALYLAAFLARKRLSASWELEQRYLFPVLLVSASFLTLWTASAEVIAMVDSGLLAISDSAAVHAKSLGLSLVWSVYGAIVLIPGIIRGWRAVRLGGLLLLAIPVLKLFLIDSFALEQGYRVAAFLSLGMILLVGGYLYHRNSEVIRGFLFEEQERQVQV